MIGTDKYVNVIADSASKTIANEASSNVPFAILLVVCFLLIAALIVFYKHLIATTKKMNETQEANVVMMLDEQKSHNKKIEVVINKQLRTLETQNTEMRTVAINISNNKDEIVAALNKLEMFLELKDKFRELDTDKVLQEIKSTRDVIINLINYQK